MISWCLAFAVLGTVFGFLATSVGDVLAGNPSIGIVAAGVEPAITAGDVIGQTTATIPAVWVLVALALAVVGAQPRIRAVGWFGVVATFALTILGPLFQLSDRALGISPCGTCPT